MGRARADGLKLTSVGIGSFPPAILASYLAYVRNTSRCSISDGHRVAASVVDSKVIFAIWHREAYLFLAAAHELKPAVVVAADPSADRFDALLRRLGFPVFRAAGNRGELRRLLAFVRGESNPLAIAVDGPSGPPDRVKPGVVSLARVIGAGIIPVRARTDRALSLDTWDERLLPLPRSHLILCPQQPVSPPPTACPAELTRARQEVESRLKHGGARPAPVTYAFR